MHKIYKTWRFIQEKLNKLLPAGMLFFTLTSGFSLPIATVTSTLPWFNFGGNLLERINIAFDEVKYRKVEVMITAYSSTADQTDDTPFITAANTRTRDGIIAANFLAFHTKIQIPEIFGDKVFTVEDRMHSRFTNVIPARIDIWMPDRYLAKKFGVQKTEIVILD